MTLHYKESPLVRGWAEWLSGFGYNTYLTLTWSDEEAATRGIYSPASAYRDCQQFFDAVGISRAFVAVEAHRFRSVPHVHAVASWHSKRSDLWGAWFGSRSSLARILPIEDGCFSYVCKYVLKDGHGTTGPTTYLHGEELNAGLIPLRDFRPGTGAPIDRLLSGWADFTEEHDEIAELMRNSF